ncbi:hypothetical protein H2198_003905 [Neophaeococcomyces mojaviensis]|uniref:Uncharacterized protein n=1 Tax=Neophaeococcomyces mojaviensis TaxID=3383035 RepID=A0ACC3AAB7_9EURO|nr:hypothetical protein H2198_003905 [Knufia sp. JES_112]
MAYPAYLLAETALWPVLQKRPCAFEGIDSYLAGARGAIASIPKAFYHIHCGSTLFILSCVAIVQVMLLANATLVGLVFDLQNVTTTYDNPPAPFPNAVESAARLYMSWADGLSKEPLPGQRDFLVDRSNLSAVGNVAIRAVRAPKIIVCQGKSLDITGDYQNRTRTFMVAARVNGPVQLRLQPHLTTWVDFFEFKSSTRTVSTLVFAAMNGTIEGGVTTEPTSAMKLRGYTGISAVACTVDVNLVDDSFTVGRGQHNVTVLSNLTTITSPEVTGVSTNENHTETAKWLACAITMYGASIWGAQPMFAGNGYLPFPYTTDELHATPQNWTIDGLTHFIEVGSGALGITMMRTMNKGHAELQSSIEVPRVSTSRSFILLGPPVGVLVIIFTLVGLNVTLYRRGHLPQMLLGRTSEIVTCAQSQGMRHLVDNLSGEQISTSQLSAQRVRFGVSSGGRSRPGFILDTEKISR